jgi:IS30 family transposase
MAPLPRLRPERAFRRPVSAHSPMKMRHSMISPETRMQIRRYFYAEHWKIGTIASALGVHPDAVRHAIESERFHNRLALRQSILDPYVEFIRQVSSPADLRNHLS